MDVTTLLLLALGGLVLLVAAARAFSAPFRLTLKAALNMLSGLGGLALVNATSSVTGLSLGLNFFNALVTGILGIPGLVLLLLMQWVLT